MTQTVQIYTKTVALDMFGGHPCTQRDLTDSHKTRELRTKAGKSVSSMINRAPPHPPTAKGLLNSSKKFLQFPC